MPPAAIALALVTLVVACALMAWRHRVRSDARLSWPATRQRDWTDEELDALRSTDAAA